MNSAAFPCSLLLLRSQCVMITESAEYIRLKRKAKWHSLIAMFLLCLEDTEMPSYLLTSL